VPDGSLPAPTVRELADYCRKNYPAVFDSKCTFAASEEKLSHEQITLGRRHLLHRNTAVDIHVDTTQPNNPSAVFILSSPRSGSTLLRVILAGHQALFSPPELYLLSFNTLQQRRDHFSGSHIFFREGLIRALMALKDCTVVKAEAMMADLEAQNMPARACFRLLQHWAGKRCLVDKTPGYALNPEVLRRAEAEFKNAKFIHLVRHPIATIRSFESIRADLVTGDPTDSLPLTPRQKGELWWLVSHHNIQSFLQTIPADRQYQIKYEELVISPQQTVSSLCNFLGITYCAEMLNPYQETQQRMTDGIRDESKILGDQKFHTFKGIDPGAAFCTDCVAIRCNRTMITPHCVLSAQKITRNHFHSAH